MPDFIRCDIDKMQEFIKYREEAKTEFLEIRKEYSTINNELLAKWKGKGAEEYRKLTQHITDNVGTIADVLDTIVDNVLVDIVAFYEEADKEIAEYNRNAIEK